MRHGLGFHNRHSAGGFQPISLFTGGVQGAWYDPSDFGASGTDGTGTLFTDSAGTTPVTAVEQPVGLMLDKSKGLVLGPELVTNGGPFVNTTGWTAFNSTLSVVSGALRVTENGVNSNPYAQQSFAVTSGKWYKVTFDLVTLNAQKIRVWVGSSYGSANWLNSPDITTTGSKTVYFLASGSTAYFEFVGYVTAGGTSEYYDVNYVSVKELAGNHAFQSTSASRPTLRARYNLLTYSEEFDNAAWNSIAAGATVTPNTNIAPDGTLTADTIAFTSGGYRYQQTTSPAIPAGQSVVYSAWVWSASKATISLRVYDASATDIAAQNVSLTTTPQRVSVTLTATASRTQWYAGFDNRAVVGGDGIAGDVIVWGAQLVPTAVFPSNTYQRIGAATDYATGAAFPVYLFFDGTDDSMLTNSVDFTGTDKMLVVAGVTKQVDLAAVAVELSPASGSNNGSFHFAVPEGASGKYSFFSRGTIRVEAQQTIGVTGPKSDVIAGIGDIGADVAQLRVNGVLAASNTNDQGTGNFGNYPLYIGRRNNATLPFNGNIYSLIIAGQSYSSGQISSTESWVAAKTPLGTI